MRYRRKVDLLVLPLGGQRALRPTPHIERDDGARRGGAHPKQVNGRASIAHRSHVDRPYDVSLSKLRSRRGRAYVHAVDDTIRRHVQAKVEVLHLELEGQPVARGALFLRAAPLRNLVPDAQHQGTRAVQLLHLRTPVLQLRHDALAVPRRDYSDSVRSAALPCRLVHVARRGGDGGGSMQQVLMPHPIQPAAVRPLDHPRAVSTPVLEPDGED
mmetsp:Transcript_46593/g.106860  ORF Transcript_46593/g.106860 Transcript_46593/m.106860 type:complete len:214 (+) Transcript_46593:999-1640(+)